MDDNNSKTMGNHDNPEKAAPKGRKPTFMQAGLLLVIISGIILYGTVGLGVSAHIPLFICLVLALGLGIFLKYPWAELEEATFAGINTGLMPMFLMLLIGIIIGTWIACGTIPYLIYLGVKIISPQWFFLSAMCVCAVISLCTGSSWTAMGTLGVVFVGVGHALGMPAGITAGAIVCGSVFGDKQSPLSETTLFAAGVAETSVFEHVRSMLWSTLPAFVFAGLVFTVLGFSNAPDAMDMERINLLSETLASSFNFNIILLLLPIILIAIIVKQVPPLLGVGIGALLGIIFAVVFQGLSLSETMTIAHYGFVSSSGVDFVDSILSKGGLNSMMWTISQVFLALAMGGVLERIGILESVLNQIKKAVHKTTGLITATLASVLALEFITADTYLPMLLGGRTFKPAFDEQKLHGKVLSRTLEDTGTLGAWLVPWSACGVFATATMGIAVVEYIPYYILGWVTPIISIGLAITGIGIFYVDGREKKKQSKKAA